MSHPIIHAKSSAKKFGGIWEDYIHLHNWLDATKAWYGHSLHRMFRHHSEGIFEMEETNQENKIPLLGDVPVVGNLFKNRTKESTKREMLVFITPKVITDRGPVR